MFQWSHLNPGSYIVRGDELSSSVGLYFRIFAHFGSRVTLTVTLLSSQCYYCSAEVILLFSAFDFNFAFLLLLCLLSHSCSHHGWCHGRSNSHFCRALWNLAFFIISCSFLFLFVLLFLAFCELHFHFLIKPSAWQPRPKLALTKLGQHSLQAISGSAQKKLHSPHAMRNHVLRLFVFYSI